MTLSHALARTLRSAIARHGLHVVAIAALVLSMGATWRFAADANAAPAVTSVPANSKPGDPGDPLRPWPTTKKKEVTGKLNLNTATEEQLMLLPTIGPSKAERVVVWRKKNGGFKRTADLRRVKGFGYKTFKRLEPYLDIKGDTTLAPKR